MSKTFRAKKQRWDDEDDFDFRGPIKSKKELRAERRNRQIRHEMKAADGVRFDPSLDVDREYDN